jgi:hypothetical protein
MLADPLLRYLLLSCLGSFAFICVLAMVRSLVSAVREEIQ